MKRMISIAAGIGAAALAAAAQTTLTYQADTQVQAKAAMEKMLVNAKVLSLEGGVMGPAVKNAPYAAEEIRENTQVLADGTRIHNETDTNVYRDAEGRVRRETPDQISIWDPATGTSYVLDPKTNTARKMSLKFTFVTRRDQAAKEQGAQIGGIVTATPSAVPPPPPPEFLFLNGGGNVAFEERHLAIVRPDGPMTAAAASKEETKTESLGNQSVEGVVSQGTRSTVTLEAGAIGNDRAIESVTERWYSPDLQVVTMLKHTDPRMGEESVRLTNIRRGAQDPSLFQVPPGYQINEPK